MAMGALTITTAVSPFGLPYERDEHLVPLSADDHASAGDAIWYPWHSVVPGLINGGLQRRSQMAV